MFKYSSVTDIGEFPVDASDYSDNTLEDLMQVAQQK